jgi:hypothetical protein
VLGTREASQRDSLLGGRNRQHLGQGNWIHQRENRGKNQWKRVSAMFSHGLLGDWTP